MSAALSIIPLGGLGEIGMNAMLVTLGDDAILIDCGVLFPDPELYGVDLVIPDFAKLAELNVNLLGYVITHGHEDHIGALPYALSVRDAPIYASRFTCGLIKHKLGEWGLNYELNEVKPRDRLQLGPFDLEFLRVTHSIPDGLAIAITTELGTVVHTGDFKIDHRPIGGERTDLARFGELGERGVLALLSDSTNSESEGVSLSESQIAEGLEVAMSTAQGRIFIACFASHIHRLQQVLDISQKLGRRVVLNGRSMVNNARLARDMGILTAPDDLFLDIALAKEAPPHMLTVMTTGSQAEPGSAISKLASGESTTMSVDKDDLVIFSSRSIPGNERAISYAINGLVRRGARVLYSQVAQVHTSGHAHKEEQRLMINLVRPRYFVPIHGELHHLTTHARTAYGCGIPDDNVFVIEDGQSVIFEERNGEIVGRKGDEIEARKIFVDGSGVGDVGEVVIRDRGQLAHSGIIVCVVTMDNDAGEIKSGPELLTRGVIHIDESKALLEEVKDWVRQGISELTVDARRDKAATEEAIRMSLRRFFRKRLDRKPVVLPLVLHTLPAHEPHTHSEG